MRLQTPIPVRKASCLYSGQRALPEAPYCLLPGRLSQAHEASTVVVVCLSRTGGTSQNARRQKTPAGHANGSAMHARVLV